MTLLFTEVRTRSQPQDQRGAWAIGWCGASQLAYDVHDEGPFPDAASGADLTRGHYNPDPALLGFAQPPNNQGPQFDMLYNCPDAADAQARRMPCNTWAPGTNDFSRPRRAVCIPAASTWCTWTVTSGFCRTRWTG